MNNKLMMQRVTSTHCIDAYHLLVMQNVFLSKGNKHVDQEQIMVLAQILCTVNNVWKLNWVLEED